MFLTRDIYVSASPCQKHDWQQLSAAGKLTQRMQFQFLSFRVEFVFLRLIFAVESTWMQWIQTFCQSHNGKKTTVTDFFFYQRHTGLWNAVGWWEQLRKIDALSPFTPKSQKNNEPEDLCNWGRGPANVNKPVCLKESRQGLSGHMFVLIKQKMCKVRWQAIKQIFLLILSLDRKKCK